MRNALRRIALGVLSTGIIATMAAGATTTAASAAVSAPQHAAAAAHPVWLWWPVVRKGDRGARVVTIQYLLDARGARLKPDGKFGRSTEMAVRWFQKSARLYPDGVVGKATWPKLLITVWRGCRGYAVKAVQAQLQHHGYRIAVTGFFGRSTEKAVKKFQWKSHLVPDGVVGLHTWNAMVVHD